MKNLNVDILGYFSYDPSSPTCLVWNNPTPTGKGKAERFHGSVAGSKGGVGWQVQVTENGCRLRSTANQVVWRLHNGDIPEGHLVMTLNNNKYDVRIENLVCITGSLINHLKAWRRDADGSELQPNGKYFACIRDKGNSYTGLGTYDTFEESKAAYRAALWERVKHLYERSDC